MSLGRDALRQQLSCTSKVGYDEADIGWQLPIFGFSPSGRYLWYFHKGIEGSSDHFRFSDVKFPDREIQISVSSPDVIWSLEEDCFASLVRGDLVCWSNDFQELHRIKNYALRQDEARVLLVSSYGAFVLRHKKELWSVVWQTKECKLVAPTIHLFWWLRALVYMCAGEIFLCTESSIENEPQLITVPLQTLQPRLKAMQRASWRLGNGSWVVVHDQGDAWEIAFFQGKVLTQIESLHIFQPFQMGELLSLSYSGGYLGFIDRVDNSIHVYRLHDNRRVVRVHGDSVGFLRDDLCFVSSGFKTLIYDLRNIMAAAYELPGVQLTSTRNASTGRVLLMREDSKTIVRVYPQTESSRYILL